ncbi:MAG: histidine kinase [Hydrogenophaga sp.]|nr:histidine kinase [Hydrogenophaga sp.]
MRDRNLRSEASADALLHELRVHQFELEQQNEELRRTQFDLALARDMYLDLYDFAPVGYCSLDENGVITQVNLTGASLLGQPRSGLLGAPLARFVSPADSDRWELYLRQAMKEGGAPAGIELAMSFADGSLQWLAGIDGMSVISGDGQSRLRLSIADVTERRHLEVGRWIAHIDADAREEERHRIALALHEDLGQRLSAIKMRLAGLFASTDRQGRAEEMVEVLGQIDHAVSSVRQITRDLRPPMIDDLGLGSAVEWLAQDAAKRHAIALTLNLDLDEERPLGLALSIGLYRFVQEALAHLLKGGGAIALSIEIQQLPHQIVLNLRRRGNPESGVASNFLEPGSAQATILAHRARLLGGHLAIDTVPDSEGWMGLTLILSQGANAAPAARPRRAK